LETLRFVRTGGYRVAAACGATARDRARWLTDGAMIVCSRRRYWASIRVRRWRAAGDANKLVRGSVV
jgi:hypothetical protein